MARSTPLPERSHEEVLAAFPALRQSLLGDFDSCRLSARWGIEGVEYDNAAQARGVLFHRFAAEVLRTLRATGEQRIPQEEALVILYEVCAQRDVPDADVVWCPAIERRLLRIAALKLVTDNSFRMDRLIDVERRLFATVRYPHPETGEVIERTVTGQPDALIADPPEGAVVLDWKTTRQPPPKGPADEHWDDAEHVSYLGYFQQRVYALLVFANYPAVQRVRLREFYPLAGEARYATLYRSDLEHVERELGVLAEVLDRALMGGHRSPLWGASPGKHCSYCPRPNHCPIATEVRALDSGQQEWARGGISTQRQADELAADYMVAKRIVDGLAPALKAWVDTRQPEGIAVKSGKGRAVLRWKDQRGGRRVFGVAVPDVSDRGPADPSLESAFSAAAERVKARGAAA